MVVPRYGMYQRENIFFSDAKLCYFDIPFQRKGIEATVSMSKLYKDIRRFNCLFVAEPYYVNSKTIKIIIPDWINVDVFAKNMSSNIKKEVVRNDAKKTTTYVFHIKDQLEFVNETNSLGYKHSYPYITVIPRKAVIKNDTIEYFETVGHLYKWYKEHISLLNNDQNIVKDKAEEIISKTNSEEERIRELCKWVQQNIRYVAFEDGLSAFKPDDAHEVIAKRYGDCKGKANLLKSLLVSVGFDARLVWVAMRTDNSENLNVDEPTLFANHMICALFWNDTTYYIDPTLTSLSFGEVPEYLQGQKVFIENNENYIIADIPESSFQNNIDSLNIYCSIDNGVLKGEGCRYFKGESKHYIIDAIKSLREADRKNIIGDFLKNKQSQDSISDVVLAGLDSFLPEIFINYTASIKSNINVFGNQMYIDLDFCKDYQNSKIDIDKRKTGIKFPYKDYVVRVSKFSIPDGYTVEQFPKKVEIIRDKYSFILSYKQEENMIIYNKEISIFDPILEKEEFKQWNYDIDMLRKAYNELIVLKK